MSRRPRAGVTTPMASHAGRRSLGRLVVTVTAIVSLLGAAAPPAGARTPVPADAAPPAELVTAEAAVDASAVERALASMSRDERIGQLFVLNVYGGSVGESRSGNRTLHGVSTIASVIDRYHPGGIILFRRQAGPTGNLTSTRQIAGLTRGVHRRGDVPAFVAIDQEHGRIERLPDDATILPPFMTVASGGTARARSAAALTARELASLGIDVNFAPVADVQTDPANPVINNRAASGDPRLAAAAVVAQVRGYRDHPVAPTLKHFPGHGDTDVDSHRSLPTIPHGRSRLNAVELAPFRAAVAAGAPMVMTGHLRVPALDGSGTPATFSSRIVTGVLRRDMGFDGVVVTDSLQMGAVAGIDDDGELAVRAIEAGVDMLLMPRRTRDAIDGIRAALTSGRLDQSRIDRSVRRILRLKASLGLLPGTQGPDAAPLSSVGGRTNRAAARRIARAGLTHVTGSCIGLPSGRVAVVGPSGGAASAAARALDARGRRVTRVTTSASPTSAQIAAARSISTRVELTVVWADTDDPRWRSLLAALPARATVVAVDDGLPTRAARVEADRVVAAYGDTPVLGRALVDRLAAGGTFQGVLGVDVPRVGRAGDRRRCTPPPRFYDVPRTHLFHGDIIAMADAGVTRGCRGAEAFCPEASLTRGQMAAFLTRALRLPAGRRTFSDTRGHRFEADVAALARAGITRGCGGTRFCPDDAVTRGQMAAFLNRAGLLE